MWWGDVFGVCGAVQAYESCCVAVLDEAFGAVHGRVVRVRVWGWWKFGGEVGGCEGVACGCGDTVEKDGVVVESVVDPVVGSGNCADFGIPVDFLWGG